MSIKPHDSILILDFGSQYAQLIARRGVVAAVSSTSGDTWTVDYVAGATGDVQYAMWSCTSRSSTWARDTVRHAG